MPSDIGARMSVTGIAGFKSAMTQGKSAVKALDAELKLSAAQFKASGDAEQYMADRSRILSQQINAQEGVVQNAQRALEMMASQGVDKASTAYTQMQATLARARTDLVNMQSAAGEAGQELTQAADSGREMADSLQSIDKGTRLRNLSDNLEKIDGILTGILTKLVNIGKSIWDAGRDASDWADDLNTSAIMAGMDAETYQRWQYAAQIVDTSVDDIVKATDKLTKKTADAKDGIAIIETETGQWGIRLKDQSGAMRDQMDVFWDFVDVLQSVENETERNALAQDYFGKSYRELLPLINAGREGWEEAAQAADVVTQGNVDNLTALNDKLQEMDQKWQTTKMTLLAQLAPAFEKVADALEYVMGLLQQWAESEEGQKTLASMGDSIAELIKNLATGDLFQKMFDGATAAIEKIASFLESITSGDIISGLKTIAAIFAGIKLSSMTVQGLNLMHSLGILGGAKGSAGAAASSGAAGAAGAGASGLLLRSLKGAGTGALSYGVGTGVLGQSSGEAAGWSAASGIGAAINPYLGAAILGLQMLVGGHTANDEGRITLGKYGGADLTLGAYGGGRLDKGYYWDDETATRLFGIANSGAEYGIIGAANGMTPESMQYGVIRSTMDAASGAIVAIDEAGQLYYQYFEDLNAAIEGINQSLEDPDAEGINQAGESYAEALAEGAAENTDSASRAGAELGEQLTEGAMEQTAAAFSAGAALASAFVSGAGSVSPAGGGSSSTYNSSYVNSVNFYGAMSAQEIASAYRTYTQTQQAGYGG